MRRSLPLALILCLTIGCGDDTAATADDTSSTTTEPTTETDSGASGAIEDVVTAEDAGPGDEVEGDTEVPTESDSVAEADTTPTDPVEPDPNDNHGHSLSPTATYGEACTQNSRIGHFQVTHDEFYAAVTGTVASGVIPLTILQPVLESGDCTMLQKVNPFCDPPCGGGDLCDHSGGCIPYPANQNLGNVSVSGLLKDPLVMEPNASDYYTDVAVPFPLFDPSAQIDLVAEGNELDGFALRAWGVPNVMLPVDPSTNETVIWEMEAGMPLTVEWDAEPGPWRMIVSLNVDQHGNSPVTMFCNVEDNGSVVIGAELIDTLLGYGVSGFATADFRRTTVDSLQLGDTGCVQMSVESLMLGRLTVAGHVPCKFDPDCPDGYVCEMAIETCVEDK